MWSPEEANYESTLREKKMNWFAFESEWKWSPGLNRFPYRPHFSKNCFTGHRWRKRNKIVCSKKQKVFPAKLKVLHRQNQFHHSKPFQSLPIMHSYLQNPLKYCANASWAFLFIKGCFPGKTHLFRLFHQAEFLDGVAFRVFCEVPHGFRW